MGSNFPLLKSRYHRYIKDITAWDEGLKPFIPLKDFPFPTTTINVGPRTACVRHRDCKNLAFGLCLIIALGDFNHEEGGHLILHEPKIILEMKPGTAVLLPSAVITHENTPIGPNENRSSFTAYLAGDLAQFVENGCCTVKSLELSPAEDKERKAKGPERWEVGWKLYPTAEHLGLKMERAKVSHLFD